MARTDSQAGIPGGGTVTSVDGINSIEALPSPITGTGVLQLVNDSPAPGGNKYYGTDGLGVRGFFALPGGFAQADYVSTSGPSQILNLYITQDGSPNVLGTLTADAPNVNWVNLTDGSYDLVALVGYPILPYDDIILAPKNGVTSELIDYYPANNQIRINGNFANTLRVGDPIIVVDSTANAGTYTLASAVDSGGQTFITIVENTLIVGGPSGPNDGINMTTWINITVQSSIGTNHIELANNAGNVGSVTLYGAQRDWISVRYDPLTSQYIQSGGKGINGAIPTFAQVLNSGNSTGGFDITSPDTNSFIRLQNSVFEIHNSGGVAVDFLTEQLKDGGNTVFDWLNRYTYDRNGIKVVDTKDILTGNGITFGDSNLTDGVFLQVDKTNKQIRLSGPYLGAVNPFLYVDFDAGETFAGDQPGNGNSTYYQIIDPLGRFDIGSDKAVTTGGITYTPAGSPGLDDLTTGFFTANSSRSYTVTIDGVNAYVILKISHSGTINVGDTITQQSGVGMNSTGVVVQVVDANNILLDTIVPIGGGFAPGNAFSGPTSTGVINGVTIEDSFSISDGFSTTNNIPLVSQTIDGVDLGWGASTGHSLGDVWTFTYTVSKGRVFASDGLALTQITGDVDTVTQYGLQQFIDNLNGLYQVKNNITGNKFININAQTGVYTLDAGTSPVIGWNDGQAAFLGGQKIQQVNTAVDYSPTSTDYLISITGESANVNINLPVAMDVPIGTEYVIKDTDGLATTYNLTVVASGGGTIDGGNTVIFDTNYQSITIVSDGASGWRIKSSHNDFSQGLNLNKILEYGNSTGDRNITSADTLNVMRIVTGDFSAIVNGSVSVDFTNSALMDGVIPMMSWGTGTILIQSDIEEYNGDALQGAGILSTVANQNVIGVTIPTVLTSYTVPNDGAGHTLQVSGYLSPTAISINTLQMKVDFQDENGFFQTVYLFNSQGGGLTVTTSGFFPLSAMNIRVFPGTTATVAVTATGIGSQTYDAGATIERVD